MACNLTFERFSQNDYSNNRTYTTLKMVTLSHRTVSRHYYFLVSFQIRNVILTKRSLLLIPTFFIGKEFNEFSNSY